MQIYIFSSNKFKGHNFSVDIFEQNIINILTIATQRAWLSPLLQEVDNLKQPNASSLVA